MAKDYNFIHTPGHLFKALWAKHNSALTFHMALTSLVTVEIPDPESPDKKIGIVLGGMYLNDKELAARLQQKENVIRNGRDELAALRLLLKRQYPYTYRLALRESDKWSSKNKGQMGPRYSWVTEALTAVNSQPKKAEVGNKPQPLAVDSQPAAVDSQPLAVDSQPDDVGTKIPKDLRKGKPSLKPSRKQSEKAKPDEKPKPAPSRSFSESKPKPSGKEISPEASQLVCDLFVYADDYQALFGSKEQRAVAALLEKYPAKDIKELWHEVWDSKDKDRKKFAVKDFLTTAEGRLEAKVVWRESVEAARQAAIRKDIEEGNKTNAAEQNRPEPQGESVDDLFARLEREAATQGAEQ